MAGTTAVSNNGAHDDVAPDPADTAGDQPGLTQPMRFAFASFAIFALLALRLNKDSSSLSVTTEEYKQLERFTLFFIAAMLPSDALIRFGRNLLFSSVAKASEAAKNTPRSTTAQNLAFAVFVVVALATLLSNKLIDQEETPQIITVARTLVIALLPSDAAIRFGRALYLKGLPSDPSGTQLKKV